VLGQIASIGPLRRGIVTSGSPILPLRAAAGKDLFGPAYGGTQFCIRLSLASPFQPRETGSEGDHLPQHSPPAKPAADLGINSGARGLLRFPAMAGEYQ